MKKKAIGIIAAAAVSLVCLAGCGKSLELNVTDAADTILSSVTFSEYLEPVDTQVELKRLGLEESDVEECCAYAGTKAVVDEIAVIKTSDPDKVTTQVESYIAAQKESYSDYKPDEVPKLESSVVKTVGDYVIYVAAADNTQAQSAVDALTTVE